MRHRCILSMVPQVFLIYNYVNGPHAHEAISELAILHTSNTCLYENSYNHESMSCMHRSILDSSMDALESYDEKGS